MRFKDMLMAIALLICALAPGACSKVDETNQVATEHQERLEAFIEETIEKTDAPPVEEFEPAPREPAPQLRTDAEPQLAQEPGTSIAAVAFEPSAPQTGDKLKAVIRTDNPDMIRAEPRYRWIINDKVVQESNDPSLHSPVKRGDNIELDATLAPEGFERSFVSQFAKIRNAHPELRIVAQELTDDNRYEARVEASDPESDPVVFSLKKAPAGMGIDAASGLIRWQAESQGSFPVEVCARDAMGAESVLKYEVRIRQEVVRTGNEKEAFPHKR